MIRKFDPVIEGPGIWYTIHTIAFHSKSEMDKLFFMQYIITLMENFKCKKCQTHFKDYVQKNPLKNYKNKIHPVFGDIGLFIWTWEFHNHVNHFLSKPKPSLEEAISYYKDINAGVCMDCGSAPKISGSAPKISGGSPKINGMISASTKDQRPIPDILTKYLENNNITPKQFSAENFL